MRLERYDISSISITSNNRRNYKKLTRRFKNAIFVISAEKYPGVEKDLNVILSDLE